MLFLYALRPLLSFELGPRAVDDLAERLVQWLSLDGARRSRASADLAALARRRFGWQGVARGVIAAASGRLDELVVPAAPSPPVRSATE